MFTLNKNQVKYNKSRRQIEIDLKDRKLSEFVSLLVNDDTVLTNKGTKLVKNVKGMDGDLVIDLLTKVGLVK